MSVLSIEYVSYECLPCLVWFHLGSLYCFPSRYLRGHRLVYLLSPTYLQSPYGYGHKHQALPVTEQWFHLFR